MKTSDTIYLVHWNALLEWVSQAKDCQKLLKYLDIFQVLQEYRI